MAKLMAGFIQNCKIIISMLKSIACSNKKQVSYRRVGLMSAFRPRRINKSLHPLIKGLHEIMRSRLSKSTASGLIIGARDYYPKVILLSVL